MELKTYQKKVMDDLSAYIDHLNSSNNLITAWNEYWAEKDVKVGVGVPAYNNAIHGVPHICMKVPTGGGKTFMACASIKRIYDAMPKEKPRVVVWLVPSDPILLQTVKTLSDVNHPYRQRLDRDFAGRVGIYTKEQLLNGQNFSPDTVREMLTVCILSYGSLRIDSKKKDIRKVYQENGNLLRFADYFADKSVLLADTPDTALIQVLRQLQPVTIVDESHNAGSDLSVDMLNNLNPSFILDLTATPRNNSNIISYVDARELKKENMVKLPVIVYNRTSRQSVIQDALQLRAGVEQRAIAEVERGGQYIRPIILFQAQPKTNEDSETFDKVKKMLVDMGIPENEIAIKTSKVDDLGKVDLMNQNCEVRYIITVNALKEGWDCPFAYVLASLANKTSRVDVEQIVGRILRQPYATQHSAALLNTSYVLTCSNDFHTTLESIVSGLNKAGFSRKDFRVSAPQLEATADDMPADKGEQLTLQPQEEPSEAEDTFADISPEDVKTALERKDQKTNTHLSDMLYQAEQKTEQYKSEMDSAEGTDFFGGEYGSMLNQNTMQPQFRESAEKVVIPQFFLSNAPSLFGGEFELLDMVDLSEGFSLREQDTHISLELETGEMYQVDIQAEGEAVPKYKRTSKSESEYIRELLAKMPEDKKVEQCTKMICKNINRNNRYATSDVEDYVHRIVANMTEDELTAMETATPLYAAKIQKKIDSLERAYREQLFYKWIDSGKIVCRENYSLPKVITPAYTIDSIPYSLYDAEKNDMNGYEKSVIDAVVELKNIKWWHRIIEKKGFCINGCINHYPDFMVMTNSGKLVIVEAKGDHLDGKGSRTRLKLGRKWQSMAGENYRYFMVFQTEKIDQDGAYTLDEFVEVMKEL